MARRRKGLNLFYYFRQGYTMYLVLIIGIVNVLTSTYFLAIEKVPVIKSIIPSFELYILYCFIIGLPLITIFGWIHFKKAGTYSVEVSIMYENNPYSYKWLPGFNEEVYSLAYKTILSCQEKKLNGKSLSDEEINDIKNLELKLQNLIDGGYVGKPPSGTML